MSLMRLVADRLASRIWSRETSPFAADDAPRSVHEAIANRLGWLAAPDAMPAELPRLRAYVEQARRDGLSEIRLLGMGGSSLCAEVLRDTAPAGRLGASLVVLDTTDERAIADVSAALVPARTLFVVASKSGSTIEVSSLQRHFWSLMTTALGERTGRHFVAITDPGTALGQLAESNGYRQVFINPPDIGGRYSALSLFGLVPAALLGLDLDALLAGARSMAERCRPDSPDNPGLALGAFMAEHARKGRDKLTLFLPPAQASLGVWIEQLIAESTGKLGRGILPIVDEPAGPAGDYGSDRSFVVVDADGEDGAARSRTAAALERAGHPVFRLHTGGHGIGAEFFRWEFATAAAGAALGINPFDEPNVKEAKKYTNVFLDAYRETGALRVDPPLKPIDGLPGCLARNHRTTKSGGPGPARRYLALLDYLPSDSKRPPAFRTWRSQIRAATRMATTHGTGPRYLHSTGQYHKGGPETGLFVLLTAPDATSTAVPGADYTFSVLKQSQAMGDFAALVAADRDVLHLHIEDPRANVTAAVEHVLRRDGFLVTP